MQWKTAIPDRSVNPSCHLVLLIVACRQVRVIFLISLEVEQEVHRKQWLERRSISYSLHFFIRQPDL